MRTTIAIDDDLLRAAKSLARARSVSVGTVKKGQYRQGHGGIATEIITVEPGQTMKFVGTLPHP